LKSWAGSLLELMANGPFSSRKMNVTMWKIAARYAPSRIPKSFSRRYVSTPVT